MVVAEQVVAVEQKLKPWRCSKNREHVLGMVRQNRNGVHDLVLYRTAVDMGAEQPDEVEVIGVIRGKAMEIRCSLCGAVRTWFDLRG